MRAAGSGNRGPALEELNRIVGLVDARGWPIFVHAIGNGGVRTTLDAFVRAAATNPAPLRGQLADIVVLTRDIFAAPATLGDDVRVAVTVFDGKVVYRR